MKRMKFLFGQRRMQVLLTLAVLLLAVSVVIGSGANFTATSANASNIFSTGTLSMSNTPTGMSVTVSKMIPDQTTSGTVIIKNTGDVSGTFYLEPVTITGETKSFASKLHLVINDGSEDIYTGTLGGLTQKNLGVWVPNAQKTFTFTVSFPNTTAGGENAYMGATATAAFDWTATTP